MKSKKSNSQKGFTIVELMIATGVFSMVLLLMATAIMQIGRAYYRGAIANRVQGVTRSIIDEVAQAIQFSARGATVQSGAGTVSIDGQSYATQSYCIGTVRYSYIIGRPVGGDADTQISHALWRDASGECVPVNLASTLSGDGGQELLGENMRLVEFVICSPESDEDCPASQGTYSISIVVAYGDNEGFTDSSYRFCKSSSFGGQFCAVSAMRTGVTKRL